MKEISNAEWDDIQDAGKQDAAEIESLKAQLERMTEQAIHFRDMAEKQGFLLVRAADALEEYLPLVHETWNAKASAKSKLIAELRKAAG